LKKAKNGLLIGNFNTIHPGHSRLFRFGKENCEFLTVVVNGDKKAAIGAYVPERFRLEAVMDNQWVDYAFVSNDDDASIVRSLRPDIVIKGKEFESRFNPEEVELDRYGGKLLFSSGETTFSSLDLLKREFVGLRQGFTLPEDFLVRHDISRARLADLIDRFSKLNICVIGDLMVDEYITCEPLGMSQEEPTLVVTPLDTSTFIGGAGIVAAHAALLGANSILISVTGADEGNRFAVRTLDKFSVCSKLFIDNSRPTTRKQRFRAAGKSLLRVSHLHQDAISIPLQDQVFEAFNSVVGQIDAVVFSDFNYGVLPQRLVDKITQVAKSHGILTVADSQSSSQMGDVGRFKGMGLITPTEREARISLRDSESGLVKLLERLQRQSAAANIILKLGAEGLLVQADKIENPKSITDKVIALNQKAADVAGAGDSLLITAALTLAAGGIIWEGALLGSLAAAIQVGRVGNTPIKAQEMLDALDGTQHFTGNF